MKLPASIRGDLSGAVSAAIVSIPMSIGYGLVAFSALGPKFAPIGALSGVYAAVLCGFLAAAFGGTPAQISGPKAPLTLVIASVVFSLSITPQLSGQPEIVISLTFLAIFLAGLFQIAFGIFGLGNLVKYVPHPVVAGFMNGIAILLIIKQAGPLLGLSQSMSLIQIINKAPPINYHSVTVGLATLFTIFISKRIFKVVPGVLMGLAVGSSLYYLIQYMDPAAVQGPVIGAIDLQWITRAAFQDWFRLVSQEEVFSLLPRLVLSALALGLLSSMESLLSSLVADNFTVTRHDSNKELIGQGIGNVASALFGGIGGAGSTSRTVANLKAGGRSRLAGMMYGVFFFVIIAFLGPQVGRIPQSVIAGILIAVGFDLFDPWTFNLLKKFTRLGWRSREIMVNVFVSLLVAVITVGVNLITAVVLGFIVASLLFVAKMGKSNIKRLSYGDAMRSNKMRSREQMAILEEEGRRIVIMELHGPIFFGSAENMTNEIEAAMKEADYCLLDLKRVNEIDSTGANVLLQTYRKLNLNGKRFIISSLLENPYLAGSLEALEVVRVVGYEHFFPDADMALEKAEDDLLSKNGMDLDNQRRLNLAEMDVVRDFSSEELNDLQTKLFYEEYRRGQHIFREGDPGRDVYFLAQGSVSVTIHLVESDRIKRLVTFCPGVIFGEMALLDGSPRSADIRADEETVVYRLPLSGFEELQKESPRVATKLIVNIARELSGRLRLTSNEVRALEDD